MSDQMRPIPFDALMKSVLTEYRGNGTVFGVRQLYRHEKSESLPIFNESIETPFGPAAGPHTQLAQNLIAAYVGGSRFFELKTVQTLDGEDLPIDKPCILALEEGYNVEWSTELTVPQAMDEYIKGWFALKLLSRELELGNDTGFVFNMSVGYDLTGIQSLKIDRFINGLMNAQDTECFRACADWTLHHLTLFERVDAAFVQGISPKICTSITLSTLHGCPPDEIERIAAYLIRDKRLNTFVKCNPTLLNYEFARSTLDGLGYDELVFDDHHFRDDLQFSDAVPMFERLLALAQACGVAFGLKLSNTFPVTIARNELPGSEMYMSGKSLYPLTIALALKLETAFGGQLRISYSGGADQFNIEELFNCGIWPVTLATTLLKPGGYNRLKPIAQALAAHPYRDFSGVALERLHSLCEQSTQDPRYRRPVKAHPSRKLSKRVPLTDCFLAPCQEGCPIHQDITAYLDLVAAGRYAEAVTVICQKNPLPHITGAICTHRCQTNCTRHFFEDAVHIRAAKLVAAQRGFEGFLAQLAPEPRREERVAVVGGGPGGMAAAFFAARAGASVTLFEKRGSLGGVVRHVIPAFRIEDTWIDNDARLLEKLGVELRLHTTVTSAEALLSEGYSHVILAVGAWEALALPMKGGEAMDALDFLEKAKKHPATIPPARSVVVVGGGNTAMDAARAAKRLLSVESVTLIYRRTRRQMPADLEELELALADGVRLAELRNPLSLHNGLLSLDVLALGEKDASGRQGFISTGATEEIACDLLISAIGQKADSAFLTDSGVKLNERGLASAVRQSASLFVIGDAARGPATVVEAIADAREAVSAILGAQTANAVNSLSVEKGLRGQLCAFSSAQGEASRCLHCADICENCVDVCPNRANIAVEVPGMAQKQILHVDSLCNECGNCAAFCPYDSKPHKDKLTLFSTAEDFESSDNQGFLPLPGGRIRLRLNGRVYEEGRALSGTGAPLAAFIQAVLNSEA